MAGHFTRLFVAAACRDSYRTFVKIFLPLKLRFYVRVARGCCQRCAFRKRGLIRGAGCMHFGVLNIMVQAEDKRTRPRCKHIISRASVSFLLYILLGANRTATFSSKMAEVRFFFDRLPPRSNITHPPPTTHELAAVSNVYPPPPLYSTVIRRRSCTN